MKLAVFHHARISGGRSQSGHTVNSDYAKALFKEQMNVLVSSRLYNESNEVFIGLNGDDGGGAEAAFCRENMPLGAILIPHGEKAESLLPTMNYLENWLPDHPDWYVCFWHMKGCTHAGDELVRNWRWCLEHHVIEQWPKCVKDLQDGYDSVGAHWMAREQFGPIVNPEHGGTPHWGGVFWWATAKYLLTLPKLPTEIRERNDWFWPEHHVGSGPVPPKVRDYHNGFPTTAGCHRSSKM